jgi:carbonic anhydrase
MCHLCDRSAADAEASASRRRFLKFAGTAAFGLALPGSGLAQKAPPKPDNIVSPDAALTTGNRRYVGGVSRRHKREPLTKPILRRDHRLPDAHRAHTLSTARTRRPVH